MADGEPGHVSQWKSRDIEIGKKAVGVGEALPVGSCVTLESGGNWDVSMAADTGRVGGIPNLAPINTDSSPTCNVLTGDGAEMYFTLNGTIKPGQRVAHDDNGEVKSVATGGFGSYQGHLGEGSGHDKPATDGADGDSIRVRFGQ
jgi:hypothetical protein